MLAGVAVMALASLALGPVGSPLARLLGEPALPTSGLALALSLAAVAAGAAAVVLVRPPARLAAAARAQFYTDVWIRVLVQRPVLAVAAALDVVERRGIDALVDGAGRAALAVARGTDWIERRAIDAAVERLAGAVGRSGEDLRRLQSGRLYEYLRDAVLGAAALAVLLVLTAVT
jgi:hypothetical protein